MGQRRASPPRATPERLGSGPGGPNPGQPRPGITRQGSPNVSSFRCQLALLRHTVCMHSFRRSFFLMTVIAVFLSFLPRSSLVVQMPRGRRTCHADHFPQFPTPPGIRVTTTDAEWERRFEHRRFRIAAFKLRPEYRFFEDCGLVSAIPAPPPEGIRTGRWMWHRQYAAWRDGVITLAWCYGFGQ